MRRLALIAALSVLLPAGTASAATFTVTKPVDTLDGACNADCSLREALQAANADGTADDIVVPPGVHMLTLGTVEDANASGDLDVLNDVTITGAGPAATTLQSFVGDRVLDAVGAGTDLTVRDVTITGGRVVDPNFNGAGIRSNTTGALVLTRVVVRGNQAQGLASFGHGGGIHKSTGKLTMRDASVLGNRGVGIGFGGGIFLTALGTSADLENVTIAGNQVTGSGGGLYLNAGIPATLTHVTIVDNGADSSLGGIGGDANEVRIRSSIVASNRSPSSPDCATTGTSGPASDGGNVGAAACGFTLASDTQAAAQLSPLTAGDIPVLEPLAGSPARDRAVGACPAADARGVARPQGGACDAGAAEAVVPPAPVAPAAAGGGAPVVAATTLAGAGTVTRPATPKLLLPARLTWRGSTLSVPVTCTTTIACAGTATVRTTATAARTTTIATGRFSVAATRRATVRLALTRKGRALVRRRARIRATLRVTFRGVSRPQTKTVTLQRRR